MGRKPFKAVPLKRKWPNRSPRRRTRLKDMPIVGALFAGAIALGSSRGLMDRADAASTSAANYSETVTNCRVVDGDTLHCDGGRIRLLGIDAPELPGHCAQGRDCARGDPYASTDSLKDGMGDGTTIKIENVGTDRYGRTLALVRGQGGDLSCWQLRHGAAIYKSYWDNGGLVAAACPDAVR